MIVCTGSFSASAICAWLISISFGTPFKRSRPATSIGAPLPVVGHPAVPISILICFGVGFADQQIMLAGARS